MRYVRTTGVPKARWGRATVVSSPAAMAESATADHRRSDVRVRAPSPNGDPGEVGDPVPEFVGGPEPAAERPRADGSHEGTARERARWAHPVHAESPGRGLLHLDRHDQEKNAVPHRQSCRARS